jgi:hypothetical protein
VTSTTPGFWLEDQFDGVEMTDDDVDQIAVVGDLIATLKTPTTKDDDEAPQTIRAVPSSRSEARQAPRKPRASGLFSETCE